jgi:CHAD domain-containing protein
MDHAAPREPISELCRGQLDRILRGFQRSLKRLRSKGASADRLHDLRVAVRRTESALFLCQPWLRKPHRRWFEGTCDNLRAASNAVRDCDVVLRWLEEHDSNHPSRRKIERQRKSAIDRLEPIVASLAKGRRMKRHRRRLFQAEAIDNVSMLAARLLLLSGQFTELAGDAFSDPKRLHRWRVTGKKLRYALDFVAELGCDAETKQARAALEKMQDRLGAATDTANRERMMGKSKRKSSPVSTSHADDVRWGLECLDSGWQGTLAAAIWIANNSTVR